MTLLSRDATIEILISASGLHRFLITETISSDSTREGRFSELR